MSEIQTEIVRLLRLKTELLDRYSGYVTANMHPQVEATLLKINEINKDLALLASYDRSKNID